jgi:hypothetical protein
MLASSRVDQSPATVLCSCRMDGRVMPTSTARPSLSCTKPWTISEIGMSSDKQCTCFHL